MKNTNNNNKPLEKPKKPLSLYEKTLEALYKASLEYFINWRLHAVELALALAIVLLFRSSVGVVYSIPTGSMIPTFKEGDVLVANRFYYGLKIPFTMGKKGYRLPAIREVDVGDVVIFRAPVEEIFYYAFVSLNKPETDGVLDEQFSLLNAMNTSSSFLRPLSVHAKDEALPWLLSPSNYIIENIGSETFGLRLHKDVYKKFQKDLEQQFQVVSVVARRTTISFQTRVKESFLAQLAEPVFNTASILASVCIDLPFMAIYKLGYLEFIEKAEFSLFILKAHTISFYPNSFTKVHKEYVKRVIAKAGDTIEMRNKRVYINGKALPLTRQGIEEDALGQSYYLFSETVPGSKKSDDPAKPFQHPVRLSASQVEASKEAIEAWPLSPQSVYASQFRDTFGPVKVPENHFFVMGDNRDESLDSRYIGFVPDWEITGTPMFIFLPFSRAGLIK